MKRRLLSSVSLAVAVAASGAPSSWAGEPRRYLVESAVVEYQLSGVQTGSVVLSFDRWGMRETRETKSETRVGKISVKNSNLVLLDGDWTYVIDPEKKTGTKMPTPLLPKLRERLEREGKDLAELGQDMLVQMGGKKVGEEQFLNKPCEVWEVKSTNTRMSLWKGVPLKTTAGLQGLTLKTTAIRVEENPTFADGHFTPPAGVTIAEAKSPLELLQGIKDRTKPPLPREK